VGSGYYLELHMNRRNIAGVACAQVVGIVARCGETTSADVQLAVVRALLTITTAEHFRAHGDCLVQVCMCDIVGVFLPALPTARGLRPVHSCWWRCALG
jgi:hypothetical protein